MFGEHRDKRTFINCLQRHLTREPMLDARRKPYAKHFERASLIAFCVMDDHYHLIVHQASLGGMSELMHSVLTGYGKYFNKEHSRSGPLFRNRYDAKPILEHAYAKRAIAYVHLNHEEKQLEYEHQSHDYFVGRRRADWVDAASGIAIFGGREAYLRYLALRGPSILALKRDRRESQIFGPEA